MIFDSSGSGSVNGTNLTFTHTCTGANVLYVGIEDDAAGTIDSVTYAGQAMSLVSKKVFSLRTSRALSVYRLFSPPSGANSVAITYGSSHNAGAVSVSYTGWAVDSEGDAAVNGTNVITPSTTVLASNCWTVGFCATENGSSNPVSALVSDKTDRVDVLYSPTAASCRLRASDSNATVSPGSNSMQFTATTSNSSVLDMASILISIAPYPGAASSSNFLLASY